MSISEDSYHRSINITKVISFNIFELSRSFIFRIFTVNIFSNYLQVNTRFTR